MKSLVIRYISAFVLRGTVVSFMVLAPGMAAAATGPEEHSTSDPAMSSMMDPDQLLLSSRVFLGRLPAAMPGSQNDTPERIALGKRLYFERGISTHKNQACHDCHLLTEGRAGTDHTPTSKGTIGEFGKRNSPTVINAGFQFAQFWDGRSPDLVDQAKGPVLNPIEMGMKTPMEVMDRLRGIEGYAEAFQRAFPNDPQPMTYDNMAVAIAAFERTLIAPGRFDKYLAGEEDAITEQEKMGLMAFMDHGCVDCHTGVTVGGQLYRKIGVRHALAGNEDVGRYEVTKNEEDRFVFKVPMLRNITRTGPYFHDGKIPTLSGAVHLMGQLQLGLELHPGDTADLVAFLGTLEGNPPPVQE